MNKCIKCDAKCCKYFALQIDSPRSKADFENLRWYLTHKKVNIFYEEKKWFLEVFNQCKYLDNQNLCTIYHKRPQICREHSNKNCEFTLGKAEHVYYFNNLEALDLYIKKRFSRKKKKES